MKVHWSDLKEVELMKGVRARFFSGEKMMFSLVRLDAGVLLPNHSHPHEQMGYVLRGSLFLRSGDGETLLGEGDMYCLGGGREHEALGGPEGALVLDVFSPPREEYLSMTE